ncbi:hypothetical protein RRG08_002270 [Elysia crispata]|uniref:Uncharacterized protein n=1 Tax=Elysia crispata TaxID=231223 RepID=A0AAE0ZAY5_9GAST|nr:hypothetical protein RRG08_002270 [Elysia crispata]
MQVQNKQANPIPFALTSNYELILPDMSPLGLAMWLLRPTILLSKHLVRLDLSDPRRVIGVLDLTTVVVYHSSDGCHKLRRQAMN